MVLLLDFYGIPMGFPWYFYDISLGLLLDFYGMLVESKLKSIEISLGKLKVN